MNCEITAHRIAQSCSSPRRIGLIKLCRLLIVRWPPRQRAHNGNLRAIPGVRRTIHSIRHGLLVLHVEFLNSLYDSKTRFGAIIGVAKLQEITTSIGTCLSRVGNSRWSADHIRVSCFRKASRDCEAPRVRASLSQTNTKIPRRSKPRPIIRSRSVLKKRIIDSRLYSRLH